MGSNLSAILYVVAAVLFILGLRGLSSPESSRRGNFFAASGMLLAVIATIAQIDFGPSTIFPPNWLMVIGGVIIGGTIGAYTAQRIAMTAMPQLVAAFHSLVGLAAVLVAWAAFFAPQSFGIGTPGDIASTSLIEMSLGVAIGAITFSGSLIACAKLQGTMSGAPILFPGRHLINVVFLLAIIEIVFVLASGTQSAWLFLLLTLLAFCLGFLLIIPIGGADMPVVVSMLNSYSGWAAAGIGFTLNNMALIVTGALVGASGAILSYIMCRGMNRSFFAVILGGFGGKTTAKNAVETRPVKQGSADDAVFILKNANSVIIVPGYGMAVAQAQFALREMVDVLKKDGVTVKYAIHPVAGRMPGHMNVLLAEANVPYDEVFELEDINSSFAQTDVAFVIGANDVTNPSAKTDQTSPIYGMPILDVDRAGTVLFVKRGMGAGYAGVENELFFRDNTMMLFADAKKMVDNILKAL